MKEQKLPIGFELIAEEGKELIVIQNGEEIARTKSVIIPQEGTLNEWIEVDEKVIRQDLQDKEEERIERIAELERQLAELRSE